MNLNLNLKLLVIASIVLATVLMSGCTGHGDFSVSVGNDEQPANEVSSAPVTVPSYDHQVTVTTSQGRKYQVSSPNGVSVGTKADTPDSLLGVSDNNWRFTGDDTSYYVQLLCTDLNHIPDIEIMPPVGEKIWFKNFQATDHTDATGKPYVELTWEQQGIKTVSVECLNRTAFAEHYQSVNLYNGKADIKPVTITKVEMTAGDMFLVYISGEPKYP